MRRLIVLIPLLVAGCGSNGLTDRMDNFFDSSGHSTRRSTTTYPDTPRSTYRDDSDYPRSRDVDPDGYPSSRSPTRLSPY